MKNSVLFLLTVLLVMPSHALAASADECRQYTNNEVAREQRLYRAYLFGKPLAEDAAVGDVRYDQNGRAWIKENRTSSPWSNSNSANPDLRWSNSVMDSQDEHAAEIPIRGIFETKRVMTSDLIPYLLQTIRALDCRLDALCTVASYSANQSGDQPVDVGDLQPLGCVAFPGRTTWPECHFGNTDENIGFQADSRTYCRDMSEQLLRRETELLKLAVEYDAGYRTLLQFAGNFDIFLRELRWPLTNTLSQAIGLIGQLERIPCFLSSCDASP